MAQAALAGLRVVELGQVIAGPSCGQLLGDLGADVIEAEPPEVGDVLRQWGRVHGTDGDSLWWRVPGRNERIGDPPAGTVAAPGAVAALAARHRTGRGQVVDASTVESVLELSSRELEDLRSAGVIRVADGSPSRLPDRRKWSGTHAGQPDPQAAP
ncbi:CoA transferase [Geodermatophilus sp. URMC 60]